MVYESFKEFSILYSKAIVEAVNIILSYDVVNLSSIILFGSCARLNIHSGSDIDLLIITKDTLEDSLIKGRIKNDLDLLSNNISADVLFTTIERFNNSDLRIYSNIKKEGVYLWKEGRGTDVYKQLLYNSKKRLPVFTKY